MCSVQTAVPVTPFAEAASEPPWRKNRSLRAMQSQQSPAAPRSESRRADAWPPSVAQDHRRRAPLPPPESIPVEAQMGYADAPAFDLEQILR